MTDKKSAKTIWSEAVEKIKDRTISPTLWRALEKTHGVTMEGGFLVVGLIPADFPMSGHLLSSEHRNTIDVVISEIACEPLRLKVIEGITVGEWETAKKREAVAEASREAAMKRRMEESAAAKTWDGVMEQVSRKYATTPMRQLPQMRARYLVEAITIVVDAMRTLYPQEGAADELTERSFSRLIERLASLVEMPPADIADRILRRRGEIR